MANKIKESDLFEGDIFQQNRESSELLLKTLKELQGISKSKISLINPESSNEIKELEDEFKKLNLQRKIGEEVRKKEIATQKKAEQENKKELDAYQRKSKELNELRKQYKATAVEQGLASEKTKELAKQVNALDKELKDIDASAGQFQRNVGNYTEAINEAAQSTGVFGGALADIQQGLTTLGGVFGGIKDDIIANTEAIKGQTSAQQKATASAKLLGNALKVGVIGAVILAGTALTAFFKKFEEGIDLLDKFTTRIEGFFNVFTTRLAILGKGLVQTFGGIKSSLKAVALELKLAFLESTNVLGKNNKEIADLKKQIQGLEDEGVSAGIETIKSAIDGLGDALEKAKVDADALFARIDDFGQTSRLIRRNIEDLNGEVAILSARSSDLTLSFADREQAEEELTKKSNQLLNAKLKLATEEFEQQKDRALLGAKFSRAELEEAIRTQVALEGITENLLEDLLGFELEVKAIQNDIAQNTENIQAQNRINREKQAKVAIGTLKDNAEVEKSIIKDVANDTNKTFEEREQKQKEFLQASENGLNQQIAVLQSLTKEQINVDELLLLNATELEIKLEKVGLGVKNTALLNDVLVQYKKDLIEVGKIETKILEDKEKIRVRNAKSEQNIQQDNLKQAEKIEKQLFEDGKRFADLTQKRQVEELERSLNEQLRLRKIALLDQKEFELENTNLTATERLEIENKYNNLLYDLEVERIKSIQQLEEEARIKRVESFEKTTSQIADIINKELDKQTEKQQEALDKQAEQREKSLEQQRERALQGQKNSFAEQNALFAKESLKREQLERQAEKKRALLQDLEAFRQAYIANLKQPNANSTDALLKAGADIGKFKVLQTVIGGLFSALDGAEDTGKGGNLDKDGGFLAKLHPNERVLTKEQNAPLLKMGVKNADLPDLVALGVQAKNSFPNLMQSVRLNQTNKELVAKIDELTNVVKNKTEYRDFTDKHGNHVSSMIEKGMKRTITYTRSKPRI